MKIKYERENLLRPAIELHSTVASYLIAAVCLLSPSHLSMSPLVGYSFSFMFFIAGTIRLHQGISILKYQRCLIRLPRYSLPLSKIKPSENYLFMGKGFLWTELHTERLYCARERRNESYSKLPKPYSYARKIEYKLEKTKCDFISKLLRADSIFNIFRPYPDVGGDSRLHGVGMENEENILMKISNRYGHHIVVGTTRTGKSRKAETYISQDIRRNKNDLVIIADPKGDADLLKRVYAEAVAAGRLSELMIFHLGFPEISCCYNPLDSFTRITELSTRVTGSLPEDGSAKAFKDFAWQFTNTFSKALFFYGETSSYKKVKQAFKRPDMVLIKYIKKYMSVNKIDYQDQLNSILDNESKQKTKSGSYQNKETNAYCALIREMEIDDSTLEDLIYIYQLDPQHFAKISSAIQPFLEKVTSGKVGELLSGQSTDKNKPFLDWLDIYKRGGIVYLGFDALTDTETASAVAESTFSALTSLASYIYKHDINAETPFSEPVKRNIIFHGDEFSDLIGSKFIPLANKGGGANFQLVLYTQSFGDIEVKLGSEAKANQVMTNLSTTELMRIQDEKTADIVIKKLPKVNVSTIMAVSGASDRAKEDDKVGFLSSNEDRTSNERVDMLQFSDFAGLPKGQSYCLKEGNQLYKLRSPMPSKIDLEALPESLNEVLFKMKEAYKLDFNWQKERS
ncbi:conjugative coupling factor TraD, PFGI-1 class [Psychromonas sp. B3M02]|uniref:type IV conjugative transfer system coupling protein TraD n=1 Tax=Psychromonas sp. B3M02 TaxID=2267226 RepID=UPI000DEAEE9C|nr:type IV conjugative transfer system coupling protein TraD [Psychromonas sp. B3M02]RBW47279.1 conjugative coupling factor TraD, PFGI-1 class [Psychromonas sp. B3M02]